MRILMCYNKTEFTPGRYLEDALRKVGVEVDVVGAAVDFDQIDHDRYTAVLFVESPTRAPVEVRGAERVSRPKLFWVHHGQNRLAENLRLCEQFQPDLVLMAHSLQLATRFPTKVRFFPFATAADIFNCTRPLTERKWDIAFVGNTSEGVYNQRRAVLKAIRNAFEGCAQITFNAKVYLHKLAALYGNAKIVINCAADQLRTLNMRLFEGMGCGALVLTDLVDFQDLLFDDGKHYVVYEGVHDVLDKLHYYLEHPDAAQEIASEGHRHVLSRHTYEDRARGLCAIIRSL